MKLEDYNAPWEVDAEGKVLDEPVDIDPEKLKKYLCNLLTDKEKLQETVEDGKTALAQKDDELKTVLREHENDEQRREREATEREKHYAELEKDRLERKKVEAIEAAFEEQGITSARAKKLAKRVTSTDEKDWVSDAQELVEDGFRISDVVVKTDGEEEEHEETLEVRPKRVVRSDGKPAVGVKPNKPKNVAEELAAAGIGHSSW